MMLPPPTAAKTMGPAVRIAFRQIMTTLNQHTRSDQMRGEDEEGRLPRSLVVKTFKFIFATLLIALAFAATYTTSATAFSESDFWSILAWGGAVNGALLLGALSFSRVRRIANAALALVTLVGIATAYLIHTDLYLASNRAVLVLLCIATGVGLFSAFQIMDELPWGGPVLLAAALMGLGVMGGGYWSPRDIFVQGHVRDSQQATFEGGVEGDATNLRNITFQATPNLYFVSFDSIAPRALLDRYLDLETTEFHTVFKEHFRRFPNFFTNAVLTGHSLNQLLALDEGYYYWQKVRLREQGKRDDPRLFAGQNPSPLLDILHKNGYETTTIYVDTYFGEYKGPYVDNYIIFWNSTVCHLLDDGRRDIAFWGYCRFFGSGSDVQTYIAEQVTTRANDNTPQFTMAHIYAPGHTAGSFRHGNDTQLKAFKTQYLQRSAHAARYLELIVRQLAKTDPTGILLVYGDHGPLVSRGVDFKDNPEFHIQDYYGILGGVYPRDACTVWFDEAAAQGYMTILDAVHALLRCLSGGESARVEAKEYSPGGWTRQGTPAGQAPPDYKDFLYE